LPRRSFSKPADQVNLGYRSRLHEVIGESAPRAGDAIAPPPRSRTSFLNNTVGPVHKDVRKNIFSFYRGIRHGCTTFYAGGTPRHGISSSFAPREMFLKKRLCFCSEGMRKMTLTYSPARFTAIRGLIQCQR
jgi:hypothetical protein